MQWRSAFFRHVLPVLLLAISEHGRLAAEVPRMAVVTMEKTRTDLLIGRLQALQASAMGIETSAVISADGLMIASALPLDVEDDRVSAMSAAMHSLGERISSELRRGLLSQVSIRGSTGYVLLMAVGHTAVLTVLTNEGAKLGLVLLEMRRAAEDLRLLVS
jgi:predicted regulator of Ras-like GTPase activity (Roadblock/LC7/MglB family)